MNKRWVIIAVVVLICIGLLVWLFIASSKSLPGEQIAYNCDNAVDFSKVDLSGVGDKCRAHVPDGTKVNYTTDPPTFGPHYPDWITKGFYDTPRAEGNLVHSMEHGYVILWYDCSKKISTLQFGISNVYAQGVAMTGGSEGSPSASLASMPKSFSDGSCNKLKSEIKDAIKSDGDHKLIAVPRIGMDYPLVLTAWDRIETLNSVDQTKIKDFINAFRDAGPEQTVEP